jgi:hypothetical protein
MKICLTVNSSPWSEFKGGGQLTVHELACALSAQGEEFTVRQIFIGYLAREEIIVII